MKLGTYSGIFKVRVAEYYEKTRTGVTVTKEKLKEIFSKDFYIVEI